MCRQNTDDYHATVYFCIFQGDKSRVVDCIVLRGITQRINQKKIRTKDISLHLVPLYKSTLENSACIMSSVTNFKVLVDFSRFKLFISLFLCQVQISKKLDWVTHSHQVAQLVEHQQTKGRGFGSHCGQAIFYLVRFGYIQSNTSIKWNTWVQYDPFQCIVSYLCNCLFSLIIVALKHCFLRLSKYIVVSVSESSRTKYRGQLTNYKVYIEFSHQRLYCT